MTLSDRVVEALVAHEAMAQAHGRNGRLAAKLARTRERLVAAIEAEVATAAPATLDSLQDAIAILQKLAGKK